MLPPLGPSQPPGFHAPQLVEATSDAQVVRGHDQSGSGLCEMAEHLVHHVGGSRAIELPGRLVGEQQGGPRDECARESHTLDLAS